MSLTTNEKAEGFKVVATCDDGKVKIGVVEKDAVSQVVDEMTTSMKNQYRLAVDKNTERQILYITGASGSGKSYFSKQFIEDYKKAYPKRPIWVFSSLLEDPTLDKIKGLRRIKIMDEKFMETDLTAKDFESSLCVFDDVDVISNKAIKKKVLEIFNSIAQIGRHYKVSVIFTSHNACNSHETKNQLNESHSIVIYPKTSGGRTLKYLLDQYLGFDKSQIRRIKNMDSRWVCVNKTYPMSVITQTEVYLKGFTD
jgi:Cdc6-like AAA superfamily ATPase